MQSDQPSFILAGKSGERVLATGNVISETREEGKKRSGLRSARIQVPPMPRISRSQL